MSKPNKQTQDVVSEAIGEADDLGHVDAFVATVGYDKQRKAYWVGAHVERWEPWYGTTIRRFVLYGGINTPRVTLGEGGRFSAKKLDAMAEAAAPHIATARAECLAELARRKAAGETY